ALRGHGGGSRRRRRHAELFVFDAGGGASFSGRPCGPARPRRSRGRGRRSGTRPPPCRAPGRRAGTAPRGPPPPQGRGPPADRPAPPPPPKGGSASPNPVAPGDNGVYRLAADLVPREVRRVKALVHALAWVDDRLYVGTGPEGQLYEVRERGHETAPLAKLDSG